MKKRLLCMALAALLLLSSCRQPAGAKAPNASSGASAAAQNTERTVSDYLTELTDSEKIVKMRRTLSRDDVDIQMTPAPIDVASIVECLLKMDLVPYEESKDLLDVPHPFTLTLDINGETHVLSVTREKVSINGIAYSADNPGALAELLEAEYNRFLTGAVYPLGEQMPFSADDVAEVRLEEHENYSDGVTTVTTTDRDEIKKIVQALSNTVARPFEADEDRGAFVAVGGNLYLCKLILQDQTEWCIEPRTRTAITSSWGEEDILVLSMDRPAIFGLLSFNHVVPTLEAHIDDLTSVAYEKAYQIDRYEKSMTHVVPTRLYHETGPVLLPKETYTCRLTWRGAQNQIVVPAAVTAALYRDMPDFVWEAAGGSRTPLQIQDAVLTLPGDAGRYFVVVRAQFSDDHWAESIFSYRSSIYPTAFYEIAYGNNDGDVVLTRADVGASMVGIQNRPYVDFILGLDLSPAAGSQNLPIPYPFTMTFSCDGEPYAFAFTDRGVTYNGKPYAVGKVQMIESLYAPFNEEVPSVFEQLYRDLGGFLAKDTSYFTTEAR